MNRTRFNGLWLGLLVAVATAGIAASGAGPAQPVSTVASPEATAISSRETAIPTHPATPHPTSQPTTTAAVAPGPSPTFWRSPTPRPTVLASPDPGTTPTPAVATTSAVASNQVIGLSVQGRPISAQRIGHGPLKIVLVGDIHGGYEANTLLLAEQLLEHFQAHPEEVPDRVSLWVIPTMNPDGLASGQRWNANDVDLNRNADTDLDGCAGNDWAPDAVGPEGHHVGAGGSYPFSEPEARAVRDFLNDAQVAVFYHSAAEAIFADTCQRHAPTARLAQVLSAATGYPVPSEGWTSYPVTGDFGDYLAGEGVAAVTLELADHENPEFERNLAGVQAVLAAADEIVCAEAAEAGAGCIWLDDGNTGAWHYKLGSLVRPIALEVVNEAAYLLDGGRVLALELEEPAPPHLILAPGDYVGDVRVLEPLDLAAVGDSLLVLDRAGDVYRYDPATGEWSEERYARPPGNTSDHYFVALAGEDGASYLLETTHEQIWRFRAASTTPSPVDTADQADAAWIQLPKSRDVDLDAQGEDVYVLTRALNGPAGSLLRFRDKGAVSAFQPDAALMHPRQVSVTDRAVYVLDRAGRRLLALDPVTGELLNLYQFPDRRAVSAIWADRSGERLLMAGGSTLYFFGEPQNQASVEGDPPAGSRSAELVGSQPHDQDLLQRLRGLRMPIDGAHLTSRDYQMPGAPRHYRLGVHEGIDFYGSTTGVPVGRQTVVRAVEDGVVLRALLDYEALSASQAEAWSELCLSLGYTPPDVLDGYRGMQIWIDHGNGLVSRYAHLSAIEPHIVEGTTVAKGQAIGLVGNSGTPASVSSETTEVHLHLELWVDGHYVGQFLRPVEAREWLEKILH